MWAWDSGTFGKEAATGSATVNLRFPGQYYDSEATLHYNWNRYYNPATGRYISSDPIGLAGGLNTFGYARQNPLFNSDYLGLKDKPMGPDDPRIPEDYEDGPLDPSYNCVSHALCQQQGWIETPYLILFKCFRPLSDDEPNLVGDIVVYNAGSKSTPWGTSVPDVHIGVVIELDEEGNTTKVRSKVGRAIEYTHHPRDPVVNIGVKTYWRKKNPGKLCCISTATGTTGALLEFKGYALCCFK